MVNQETGESEYHTEKYYCTVKEVMELAGCKTRKAYAIIRSLRDELISSGRLTPEYPQGRIPRQFLEERLMINRERRT